jgi:hypothetical protein
MMKSKALFIRLLLLGPLAVAFFYIMGPFTLFNYEKIKMRVGLSMHGQKIKKSTHKNSRFS